MSYHECYFEECNECEFQDCNGNTLICLISRLCLAFHILLLETPMLNMLVDKYKLCNWFVIKK